MRIFPMLLLVFIFNILAAVPAPSSNLDSLVQSIASATTQDLSSLSFFELNILKNVIFSSKGYKYADDRDWLYEYFYDNQSKLKKHSHSRWDMGTYDFPRPVKGNKFTTNPVMEKAIANVRVSLYKKIRSFRDVNTADTALDREYWRHCIDKKKTKKMEIFGRQIEDGTSYRESIKREVHGYRCMLSIIDENRNFDACELLGVYVGSVAMLKNVIEAQNGKTFDGVMGWEISQLVGITPNSEQYDENKLIDKVKNKIKMLEAVIQKMTNSQIGDIPDQFKNRKDFSVIEYLEGC